jgi:O-antigen ligase/tetratricopeptide (TPR) repeat protein
MPSLARRGLVQGAPFTESWIARAAVISIALKATLIPLAFDPAGEDAFGVAKSAVSRVLAYVLVALLAAEAVRSGSVALRRPIAVALAAVVTVAAAATAVAPHQSTALYGAHHRYLGLTSMVDGAILALAAATFVRGAKDVRDLSVGLGAGAVGVIGYALIQLLGLDPIDWSDPVVSSTLGNRGVFAGYLVIVAAGAASMIAARWDELGWPWRAVLATAAVVMSLLVIASGARGPVLALAPALGIGALTGWRTTARRLPVLSPRAVGMAILGMAVAVGVTAVSPAGAAFARLASGGDTSLSERALVYGTALEMIRSRPLLGAGPDGFAVMYPTTRQPSAADVAGVVAPGQTSAHSWPLHHLVSTGIVGAVALAVLLGIAARTAWRRRSVPQSLGLALTVASLLQGVFNITSVGTEWLLWLGVGLCAAQPQLEPVATPRDRARRAGGTDRAWMAAAMAVALIVSPTTLRWVQANRDVRASDSLRVTGRFEAAERAASSAVALDAGRANSWNVLGLAISPRDPARALAAFERAWAAAPYESRYLINVVKEETRLGQRDPRYRALAEQHARRAVDIDPLNPETHQVLSYIHLIAGRAAEARAEAETAIRLAPAVPFFRSWAADIYDDTGDPDTAVTHYIQYIAIAAPAGPTQDMKVRLARLYAKAGRPEKVAELIAAPRVASVRTDDCANTPTCIRVSFDAVVDLVTGGGLGAVDAIASYRISGGELPMGSRIEVLNPRMVIIRLPADAAPLRNGLTFGVNGVLDEFGQRVHPDPTTLTLSGVPLAPARALVVGPSVAGIRWDDCANVVGTCVRVSFASATPLRSDGVAGSITAPSSYLLNGADVPLGTQVELVNPLMVIVRFPDGTRVRAGDRISVRGIRDNEGGPLVPDPTTMTLP